MGTNIKNGSVVLGSTEMDYVSFGAGNKNLIVLPGLSDGLATVKGKALLLAGSYKCFFKDFTVYMFSRKNQMPADYTIEQMAEDQVQVLKLLGIDKTSVLGVSQGGMIAQCIAIRHPEVMDKLILAVTSSWANEVIYAAVSSWIEMANNNDHLGLMLDTAEKTYSQKYFEKNRKLLSVAARFTKPKTYDRFLINANAILGFDVRKELSKIQCSTLIIGGDCDNTVGNDAPYELNCGIKNSELFIYNGLGHGAFEEAEDFYRRVYDFCRI